MAKITKRTIDKLLNEDAGTVLRDDELKGFQARRNAKGITFAYEYRPGGGGRAAPVRRMTIGAFGAFTADEARNRAKELAREVASGEDPAAKKAKLKTIPTLMTFTLEHLDAMTKLAEAHPEKATLRLGTIRDYRGLMQNHVGPFIGSRRLDQITKDEVKRLHSKLGIERPTTANRCLALIGSIYRAAGDAGHVEEGTNPARNIKLFKEIKRERFLSAEELARLGEAIRIAETSGIEYQPPEPKPGKKAKHIPKTMEPYIVDPFSAAAIRLLIFSGARLREILHAKWGDLDEQRGLLKVFGKTGFRHIFLSAPAMEIISQLDRLGVYIIASSDPSKPKADLNRPWRAIRKLADLEDVRIHDLRHSFASVAVSGGASLPMIGNLLGHTQAQTTARYAHLANDPVRAAAEATAGTIAGALNGTSGEVVKLKRGV